MNDAIHVLHVDDDPEFAEMAATFLEREDSRITVETETSASQGLARLADGDYDCIVSDYDMPGQTGIDLLEAIREDDPELPFILYTGKGSEEVASQAISNGATDHLQKESGTSQYTILAKRIRNAVSTVQAEAERLETLSRVTDAVYTLDTDWRITYVNEETESIMGPKEEILGENFWEQFPEAADGVVWEKYHEAMETQEPKSFDIFYKPLDLWATVTAYPSATGLTVYFRDITERRRRENRFEAIFNNTYTFTGLMEPDGTLLEANETALTFGNLTREDVVGKPIWDTYWFEAHEDARTTAKEAVEQARTGELYRDEITIRGSDEDAIIDFSIRPIFDEKDDVTLLVPEGRDITERRKRERELERTRTKFEQVFEESNNAIFISDIENDRIVDCNQAAADLVGVSRDELRSLSPSDLHPHNYEAVKEWVETVFEDRSGRTEDITCRRPDSEIIPVEMSAGVADFDGTTCLVNNVVDITERKEHQRIIENREQTLRSAYEIIAEKNRSVSEKIDALLAVGRSHIGTDYATFSHIDGGQYEFEAIATAPEVDLEAGETTALSELPICERVFQSGQPLVLNDVEAEAPELVDPTWGISCYLGAPVVVNDDAYGTFCFYDVKPQTEGFSEWEKTFVELLSDWMSSELTRQQAHDRLQRQNERLDKFASVVSHDLGNPLKVADGRLELARETGETEHFDAAERALDRLDALIEDLANVMREGQLTNELTDVDLETVAQSCWATLDTAGASVVFEETRSIRADENALTRLLENLIRNAVDHAGEDVTVRIGVLRHGFYIEDDGSGISEDEQEDIFEPGFTTKKNSTGFGMVSVRQIALAHGWDVSVTESSDGGARIEFTDVGVT